MNYIERGVVPFDQRVPSHLWNAVEFTPDECWIWTREALKSGYGYAWLNGRSNVVHRIFYERLVGPIETECLDHLCRERSCVNPAHLEAVSQRENIHRGPELAAIRARKACPVGHAISGKNVVVERSGTRRCRACRNGYQNARKMAKRRAAK